MLNFHNVAFSYAAGQDPAIKDVTFDLDQGSFHFLCGPSGAGKTTLFRMMYLDLLPTQGRLTVFGKNVNQMSNTEIAFSRRRMGVVFQDFRLLNHLTVFDNVMLPLTLHGIPTKAQVDCVKEILDWVGLGDKHAVHPHSLSGGEQQRVAIARAVVNRPQVLIADEPTGNVDAAMGRRIFHLFCELHKHGTTVLVATHDDNLVRSYDYPCLYINHGRLIRRRDVRGAA